jgi:hypothetical protein
LIIGVFAKKLQSHCLPNIHDAREVVDLNDFMGADADWNPNICDNFIGNLEEFLVLLNVTTHMISIGCIVSA